MVRISEDTPDLKENFLALLGAGVYGLTTDEAFEAVGLGYRAKLSQATLDKRDARIIELRNTGLTWHENGSVMKMNKQTAQKAWTRRMKAERDNS